MLVAVVVTAEVVVVLLLLAMGMNGVTVVRIASDVGRYSLCNCEGGSCNNEYM